MQLFLHQYDHTYAPYPCLGACRQDKKLHQMLKHAEKLHPSYLVSTCRKKAVFAYELCVDGHSSAVVEHLTADLVLISSTPGARSFFFCLGLCFLKLATYQPTFSFAFLFPFCHGVRHWH